MKPSFIPGLGFKIVFIFFFSLIFQFVNSQELKCRVSVYSKEIQGTNRQVFNTMQTAIYEFMNNTVWTDHVYTIDERIECNILINIREQLSADEFRGTIQVQSSRPVYNSNYNTTMLNYKDDDFHIRYVEFEPLEFSENTHISNLSSILAFYAYMILGIDYDSFSPEGGSPYFKKAEKVVNNAQNSALKKGWIASDSREHKNRYWFVNDMLDREYRSLREFLYLYHRQGLDRMDKSPNEARLDILDNLKLLQKIYREKPDPYMYLLKIFIDVKSDEFINIFSEGFPEEKTRAISILSEIDPVNSSDYEKIKSSN